MLELKVVDKTPTAEMKNIALSWMRSRLPEQAGLNMMGELFKSAVGGKSPAAMEALRRALAASGVEDA